MLRKIYYLFFLLLLCSCQKEKTTKLTIATAANMQFAIKDIAKSFSEETGIDCEVIIGSSGKLTAQIQQGAPFDIFLSADMKYPVDLQQKGFALDTAKVYAYGSLVLWTTNESILPSIDLLKDNSIRHIAIANPKTAPYGFAALEILQHYQLYETVQSKLVYGESIAQTNQFITTQAADVGFTAKSVVMSPKLKSEGQWIAIPTDIYRPIAQGVVVLKHAKSQALNARKFYNFLASKKCKEILNNFGYETKDATPILK